MTDLNHTLDRLNSQNQTLASTIAFGVELETTMPETDTTPVGSYHNGYRVAWLPEGWKAERDSSIKPQYLGRKGVEFVSPILKGAEGLQSVITAIKAIEERGGRVNHTCGVHVTVTFNGNAAALARLISLVGNHEEGIYASTGSKRRKDMLYCKGIKKYGSKDAAKAHADSDRYHLLNLTHIARGRNRVEFRAFSGSLNVEKVIGWILMSIGLVELALTQKRSSSWNYTKKDGAKSCWDLKDAGEGATELNRLYYRLGWTTGWYKGENRNHKYGDAGLEATGMTFKQIKKKLIAMGRKYDQQ